MEGNDHDPTVDWPANFCALMHRYEVLTLVHWATAISDLQHPISPDVSARLVEKARADGGFARQLQYLSERQSAFTEEGCIAFKAFRSALERVVSDTPTGMEADKRRAVLSDACSEISRLTQSDGLLLRDAYYRGRRDSLGNRA